MTTKQPPNCTNHQQRGETTSPPSHRLFWSGSFIAVLNVKSQVVRLLRLLIESFLPQLLFLPPSLHPCCSSSCPRGPIVPLRLPLIDSGPLKGHLGRIWLDTHNIRQTNVFFKPSNSELHQRPGERLRGLMVQHLLVCSTRSAKQLFVSPVWVFDCVLKDCSHRCSGSAITSLKLYGVHG